MSLLAQIYTGPWLLAALFAFYAVYKYTQYTRLSAFKGPPTSGWFSLWQIRAMLGSRRHVAYKAVNEKYGPIARVGPNVLITSSAEVIAHINGVRSGYTRAAWFYGSTRIDPGKDHCFSELDEDRHNKRRQQLAAGYSGRDNVELEPNIDIYVQDLLDLLRSKYLSTDTKSLPLDFARKIQYYTLDVISMVGFGEAFGDLKSDSDKEQYIEFSEQGFALVAVIVALGLVRIVQWPPIARFLGPSEKDKFGLGKVMALIRKRINARLEKPIEGRSDMIASFTGHGLTRDDLFVEAFLQLVAGADTSATAIRSTMLYLLANPRVYKKLQVEVDAAAPAAPGIASDALLRTLPYLQAVVREGLRIHPPAALEAPKVVPAGGDTVTVNGTEYFLPGGTTVALNAWGLHRDPALFGPDPDMFRPERWLACTDCDEAQLAVMRRVSDMNFGTGKYQCLGKTIAWMEITKAVFECVRGFEWALATPETPWSEWNFNGIFRQEGLWVLASAREPAVSVVQHIDVMRTAV